MKIDERTIREKLKKFKEYNWKYYLDSVDDKYNVNPVFWRFIHPFKRWGAVFGLKVFFKSEFLRFFSYLRWHLIVKKRIIV